MQDIKLTVVQTKLHWEDAAANRDKFARLTAHLQPGDTDLVVLPEMFTTGFTMKPQGLDEPEQGDTLEWMRQQAARMDAVVTGSIIVGENDKYYNRLFWVRPDGSYNTYNKRHLFTMAGEQEHYTPGKEKLITDLKGWKVCPMVCYDLRFPVWCRNTGNDYDLLLFVANWPDKRSHAWRQLLIARAIENQAYVVGVNRTGHDGNDHYYAGYSGLIDPLGENADMHAHEDYINTYTLSAERLRTIREKMPFLPDADKFELL